MKVIDKRSKEISEEWHKVDATLIINGDFKQDED